MAPRLVGGHRVERESPQAEVLSILDHGLDVGMVAVEGVLAGMVVAGQVMCDGLEPPATPFFDLAGVLAVFGMQGLEAGDDAHAVRPAVLAAVQVEQAGQFSDVGAVADLAFRGDRAGPGLLGDLDDRLPDGPGDVETDAVMPGVAVPGGGLLDPLQEVLGGARTVAAEDDFPPVAGRELGDCLRQDGDVVPGGVVG